MSVDANTVLLVAALVLAGGYLMSLWLHPYTSCRACKGRGRRRGALFTYSFGNCPRCKGTGRKVRFGNRVAGRTDRVAGRKS